MNIFQLIKTVLDEAYAQIPGNPEEKDRRIISELAWLTRQYSNLTSQGCIDYSPPCRRFAYLYRYTTCHANLVYQVVRNNVRILRDVLTRENISLACIGGGPGSDFLGIIKYLMETDYHPSLSCKILERDPAWGESWSDVHEKLGGSFSISTIFHPMDVRTESSWRVYTKYLRSDLVTLVYFLSEVYASRREADTYFAFLFDHILEGTPVLFIDNNDSQFYNWFDELATRYTLRTIFRHEDIYQMPWDEEKTDLGDYYLRFPQPKLEANVAVRICIKNRATP